MLYTLSMKNLALAMLLAAPTFTACEFNDEAQLVPAGSVPDRCTSNCPKAPPLLLHRMEAGEMRYIAAAELDAAAHGSYLVEVTGAMDMPAVQTNYDVVLRSRNQIVVRVGAAGFGNLDVASFNKHLSNQAKVALNVQDVATVSLEPLRYKALANTELVYLQDHVYGVVTLRSATNAKLGDNSMLIVGEGISQERWDGFSYIGSVGQHTVQVAADSLGTARTLAFTTVAQTESATLVYEPSLSTATVYAYCAHAMAGTSEVVTKWKFVAPGRHVENNNCMSIPVGAGTVHVTATAQDGRVIEQDIVSR